MAADLITLTWPRTTSGHGMTRHGGMINGQRKCAGTMMDGMHNMKKNKEKRMSRLIQPLMEKLLLLSALGVKLNEQRS